MRPPVDMVRARLRELGAVTEGAHFESNVILDNGQLLGRGALLRLRTQEFATRTAYVLTFKFRPANAVELEGAGIKAREELEVAVADGPMLERILGHMGYMPVARYEKLREEWRLDWQRQPCAVALDTLPFGQVAEVEAPPELMDAVAAAAGLDKCETSPKNYYDLHREISPSSAPDILFSPADREVLRAALHKL